MLIDRIKKVIEALPDNADLFVVLKDKFTCDMEFSIPDPERCITIHNIPYTKDLPKKDIINKRRIE